MTNTIRESIELDNTNTYYNNQRRYNSTIRARVGKKISLKTGFKDFKARPLPKMYANKTEEIQIVEDDHFATQLTQIHQMKNKQQHLLQTHIESSGGVIPFLTNSPMNTIAQN